MIKLIFVALLLTSCASKKEEKKYPVPNVCPRDYTFQSNRFYSYELGCWAGSVQFNSGRRGIVCW